MNEKIIQEDIAYMLESTNINLGKLKKAKVLITGVTGQIGSSIAYALRTISKTKDLKLNIIGLARNYDKGNKLKELGLINEFVCHDICESINYNELFMEIDYIFHCAAITESSKMVSNPVQVIITSVDGTKNLLEYAKLIKCKSIVYLSSMEVYGVTEKSEVSEKDLGYIDLTLPRSCYPESKRLCEQLCVAYYNQFKVPVKIARLAQTFGAGTSENDTRIYGQFARSIMKNENIVLHTEGKSRGNYCYSIEAISALLTILINGNNGEIYNVANPKASVTIKEMAEILAKEYNISIEINIPENYANNKYAPQAAHIINIDKINRLGWKPRYEILDFYKRMLASID